MNSLTHNQKVNAFLTNLASKWRGKPTDSVAADIISGMDDFHLSFLESLCSQCHMNGYLEGKADGMRQGKEAAR